MSDQTEPATTDQGAQGAPIVYDAKAATAARGFVRFALALAREGLPRDVAFSLAAHWIEQVSGYDVPDAPPPGAAPAVPPLWMTANIPARRALPADPGDDDAAGAMLDAVAATYGLFYREVGNAGGDAGPDEDEARVLLGAFVRKSLKVWRAVADADAVLDPLQRRRNAIWDAARRAAG